ncbi:hypothetical protein FKM82_005154 [Ascaphus truei]
MQWLVVAHCQCCTCSFGPRARWRARVGVRHCGVPLPGRGSAAQSEPLALSQRPECWRQTVCHSHP